jgi:ABC-2 type transport system ATP-binding protein
MIELIQISKSFHPDFYAKPFLALDKVSFQVPQQSVVGFLGANGAGKTTSFKIILDFIRADSGTINYSKELLKKGKIDFSKIGYLPERPYFYPHLTGEEFALYMGSLVNVERTKLKAQISSWAEIFKISHALKRPLKTYSKGMLQRMGFLITLLHDPQFIMLDEPLSGLDPVGRLEMKTVIRKLREDGKTLFFSSHVVPDVEEICDRVIFLEQGKMVYDGSVDELLRQNIKPNIKCIIAKTSELITPTIHMNKSRSGYVEVIIKANDKQMFLNELKEKNIELFALEPEKSTLEEIFYHIKS